MHPAALTAAFAAAMVVIVVSSNILVQSPLNELKM